MSRVEDIRNDIWSDPDFALLPGTAKLVYIWSWTNPRCDMAGIYKVGTPTIAHECGIQVPDAEGALADLQHASFILFDGAWLLVRTRVKHLRSKGEKMAKSVARDIARVPSDHPFRSAFLLEYDDWGDLKNALETEGIQNQPIAHPNPIDSPSTPAQIEGIPEPTDSPSTTHQWVARDRDKDVLTTRSKENGDTRAGAGDEQRPEIAALCERLAAAIRRNDPKAKPSPESQGWINAVRLLIDRDGRTLQEIERVIEWCQADEFWRGNILSAPKLREKFAQLALQMQRGPQSPTSAAADPTAQPDLDHLLRKA